MENGGDMLQITGLHTWKEKMTFSMRTWNNVELTYPYSYVKGLQYKNHFSPGKLTQYICLDSLVYLP